MIRVERKIHRFRIRRSSRAPDPGCDGHIYKYNSIRIVGPGVVHKW